MLITVTVDEYIWVYTWDIRLLKGEVCELTRGGVCPNTHNTRDVQNFNGPCSSAWQVGTPVNSWAFGKPTISTPTSRRRRQHHINHLLKMRANRVGLSMRIGSTVWHTTNQYTPHWTLNHDDHRTSSPRINRTVPFQHKNHLHLLVRIGGFATSWMIASPTLRTVSGVRYGPISHYHHQSSENYSAFSFLSLSPIQNGLS